MPSDIQNVVATFNDYYKTIIFPTVRTIYRTSTPTLSLLDAAGAIRANGSESDAQRSTGSHIMEMYNDSFQIDVEATPIFAASTGENAKIIAGSPDTYKFTINAVNLFNSVQYSEKSLKATASRVGGIESAADSFQRNLTSGWKRTLGRQVLGDGTGVLAYVTSGTGTGTVTSIVDADRSGAAYLSKNMYIQIAGATGGTSVPGNVSGTQITAITGFGTPTATLTLADPLSFTDGAIISQISPDGSGVTELTGLGALIANTGTIQGQDISAAANMQSHIYSTPGNFDAGIAQGLYEQCQTGKPNYWIMNQKVWAAARNSVLTLERTGMGPSGLLDIGYKTMTAMGGEVSMILDYDMNYGEIFMLYVDGYTLGILDDLHYIGLEPITPVPTYPIFETKMGWYGNLAQSAFEPNAKYSGITA